MTAIKWRDARTDHSFQHEDRLLVQATVAADRMTSYYLVDVVSEDEEGREIKQLYHNGEVWEPGWDSVHEWIRLSEALTAIDAMTGVIAARKGSVSIIVESAQDFRVAREMHADAVNESRPRDEISRLMTRMSRRRDCGITMDCAALMSAVA